MANTSFSGDDYEYVSIDTAPGASGYFTNEVMPRDKNVAKIYFSIREAVATASGVVTLQYKCEGDSAWQDYYHTDGAEFQVGERYIIEDYGNTRWRAGIKNGDYTSGTIKLGIDW